MRNRILLAAVFALASMSAMAVGTLPATQVPDIPMVAGGSNSPLSTPSTVTSITPITGTMTTPDPPQGPINADFIRGVCYTAVAMQSGSLPPGVTIGVTIGDHTFDCARDLKPPKGTR